MRRDAMMPARSESKSGSKSEGKSQAESRAGETDGGGEITAHDLAHITAALGREPRCRVVAVPWRNARREPGVIACHPLMHAPPGSTAGSDHDTPPPPEPFPTLYWLIDAQTSRAVDRLEQAGGVAEAQTWLDADPARRAALLEQSARYAATRAALLDNPTRDALAREHPRILDTITHTGIGGSARPDRLKCLHMHLAHHLATGDNLIGARVAAALGLGQDR